MIRERVRANKTIACDRRIKFFNMRKEKRETSQYSS